MFTLSSSTEQKSHPASLYLQSCLQPKAGFRSKALVINFDQLVVQRQQMFALIGAFYSSAWLYRGSTTPVGKYFLLRCIAWELMLNLAHPHLSYLSSHRLPPIHCISLQSQCTFIMLLRVGMQSESLISPGPQAGEWPLEWGVLSDDTLQSVSARVHDQFASQARALVLPTR